MIPDGKCKMIPIDFLAQWNHLTIIIEETVVHTRNNLNEMYFITTYGKYAFSACWIQYFIEDNICVYLLLMYVKYIKLIRFN